MQRYIRRMTDSRNASLSRHARREIAQLRLAVTEGPYRPVDVQDSIEDIKQRDASGWYNRGGV